MVSLDITKKTMAADKMLRALRSNSSVFITASIEGYCTEHLAWIAFVLLYKSDSHIL